MTSNNQQENELRRRAERIIQEKTLPFSENLEALSPEEVRLTLHELQVNQVELEVQNRALCQSQAELDTTKERYFELYDQAPVGYCTVNEKGLILEANRTIAALLGLLQSALIKRPFTDFIRTEDQDTYYLHHRQLFETSNPQRCELQLTRNDGTEFWGQLHITISRHLHKGSGGPDDGGHECWINLTDITECKHIEITLRQSEEERRQSEAKYRDLVENLNDAIFSVNSEGMVTYVSPPFRRLSGYASDDMVGHPFSMIIHPDDLLGVQQRFREVLANRLKPWEFRYYCKDGRIRWARTSSKPIFDGGRAAGIRGMFSDITKRKESEIALQALLAEKEVLLKEVHHRVKNNLAAIMGLVDIQRQTLTDEAARTAMTELSARIRSMALVHEQLYHSDNLARIDMQDYLDTLVAHLRWAYEKPGSIQVSIAAEGVTMGLDYAVPCGLLITELVTNTFKYAFPEGQTHPGATSCQLAVSVSWDGAVYSLVVADNGVGLPAGFDWTTTTTLGLMLVGMLGQHQLQGKIEMDCSGGTMFRLRFAPKQK